MSTDLETQPTAKPTRKVASAGAGGLAVVVILAVLAGFGVEVPGVDTDALPVGEAITGLAAFASAYWTRERSR